MDIRPLAAEAPEFNIADPLFRRGFLAFRWLLLLTYVALVRYEVLDVSTKALLVTGGIIAAYNVFHTAIELSGRAGNPVVECAIRYLDLCTITAALIAIHDVKSPVWAIYFMTIVGAAHVVTRKEMLLVVAWAVCNTWHSRS